MTLNEAGTLTYYISFQSFKSQQHEYDSNLEMKLCEISLILREQVSIVIHFFKKILLIILFQVELTTADSKKKAITVIYTNTSNTAPLKQAAEIILSRTDKDVSIEIIPSSSPMYPGWMGAIKPIMCLSISDNLTGVQLGRES